MAAKTGICKFCGDEKPLIRAHIISKTLFKPILRNFGPVHYVNVGDIDTRNKVQDAFFDTSLLCLDCDGAFGVYEDYFVQFLKSYEAKDPKLKIGNIRYFPPEYAVEEFTGLDNDKLRMFFLITLWRCSVSKQSAFRDIDLKEREEGIKKQIESGVLNDFNELSCVLISLQDVDDVRTDTAITPLKATLGSPVILFMVNRWMFIYCLGKAHEIALFDHRLNQSGMVPVIKFTHDAGLALINKITGLDGNIRR